jgi:hypothetical protein
MWIVRQGIVVSRKYRKYQVYRKSPSFFCFSLSQPPSDRKVTFLLFSAIPSQYVSSDLCRGCMLSLDVHRLRDVDWSGDTFTDNSDEKIVTPIGGADRR